MENYKVKYEIEIGAESPVEAALKVEDIFRSMLFRPYFTVEDEAGEKIDVDLEEEVNKQKI